MSDLEELKKSLDREKENCDGYINNTKGIADLVPVIQERKEEVELKAYTISQMPPDVADEFASKVLHSQLRDEKQLTDNLPVIPNVQGFVVRLVSSSGSASVYVDAVYNSANSRSENNSWAAPVIDSFNNFAQQKANKENLPSLLDNIHPDIGAMFKLAYDDFEKAISSLVGIDQASIRIRDVIEQTWGGLCHHANSKLPDSQKKANLELKKPSHRVFVSNSLASPPGINSLIFVLDDLFTLHDDISKVCKQPLCKDIEMLKSLQSRWVLLLVDLVRLVNI